MEGEAMSKGKKIAERQIQVREKGSSGIVMNERIPIRFDDATGHFTTEWSGKDYQSLTLAGLLAAVEHDALGLGAAKWSPWIYVSYSFHSEPIVEVFDLLIPVPEGMVTIARLRGSEKIGRPQHSGGAWIPWTAHREAVLLNMVEECRITRLAFEKTLDRLVQSAGKAAKPSSVASDLAAKKLDDLIDDLTVFGAAKKEVAS
jgi:hypothetical protein